jgi:nitrogen fixation NifU-like protein
VTVYLKVDNGVVQDVHFEGAGCAIATASASLMTEALKGRTLDEVEALFRGFHALVTDAPAQAAPELGKLQVLAGVREFPARVKCATLAWHTLNAALRNRKQPVTTE